MPKLSKAKNTNIIARLNEGLSLKKISSMFGVHKSTVSRIKKANNIQTTNKPGRPKKLSARDEKYCVKKIISGESQTATKVAKDLKNDFQIQVSRHTVARSLKSSGLRSGEKKKKPALSEKNRKLRLEFAKIHRDWTFDDWSRVIFSDESKINRFNSDGRSWCWFRDVEAVEPRTVNETHKFGGGGIMVWSCFSVHGVGYMCKIEGKMDQALYKVILEGDLMSTIEYYDLEEDKIIFMHDNDPKHKAKSVTEWIESRKFECMDWPPQSPDLNPLENLWSGLKRRLNAYSAPPKGLNELWERVTEVWNSIDAETCKKLIESMPNRMKEVIKAKGRWTKY